MRWHIVAGVTALLVASGAAAADTFVEGVDAYRKGAYATALEHWRPLAEQGDVTAQFNLGIMHSQALGASQDHAEAMAWFKRAAEQGDPLAAYSIGLLFADGLGVAQDYAQAAAWYEIAAERGHPGAMVDLAVLYANGRGVPLDVRLAVYWDGLGEATECILGESDMNHGLPPRVSLERR